MSIKRKRRKIKSSIHLKLYTLVEWMKSKNLVSKM